MDYSYNRKNRQRFFLIYVIELLTAFQKLYSLILVLTKKNLVMEREEIKSLLEVINQQVNSAILGGMDEQYEELENLGYIKINRESVQWSSSITPEGMNFLHNYESF